MLAARHRIAPGEPPDVNIRSTAEVANVLNGITATLTAMLAAIAAISLVVGGVGIMNIMLVSVTERTREIGLRMALGARPRDILRQFLVEAVVLSSLGGVIGILTGVAASYRHHGPHQHGAARLDEVAVRAVGPGGGRGPGVRGRRGDLLRLLPGPAGEPTRPHRGAAL